MDNKTSKALEIKEYLKKNRAENLVKLEKGEVNGIDIVRSNSKLVDEIIISLFQEYQDFEQVAVVAVGGYGRRELAPFSDIDILFLLPDNHSQEQEKTAETVLYILWDCGFKVGQSFRNLEQCLEDAKKDIVFRTNLLENRLVLGNKKLFLKLNQEYNDKIIKGSHLEFIKAKLAERENRLKKTGYSRYFLEPDVKEGQGALRDLHLIFWLTKYLFGITEMAELAKQKIIPKTMVPMFIKAHIFFSTIRCFLHYYANRAENRLNFETQQKIANVMGFKDSKNSSSVEKFMKAYYLHTKVVGDLTRMVCSVFEDKNIAANIKSKNIQGFVVSHNHIDFISKKDLKENPIKIIKIFHLAHNNNYEIHSKALHLITENLKLVFSLQNNQLANNYFLEILTSFKNSEKIIRIMSDVGVLGRFIPDFARIIAQMQFDMYHIYTTDEHTIRAIGILNNIEQLKNVFDDGKSEASLKFVKEIASKIHLRKALYTAIFLHDIAKGRGGNHSEIGAKIAQKLAPRFGLTESETENVSWLVKHHQIMSQTAFQRDVFDIKTITDFAAIVKSPERLKQLYVLTCADIIAVGPDIWTSWKATLLFELYKRTEEYMQGACFFDIEDARVKTVKQRLRTGLIPILNNQEIEEYLANAYPSYWLGYDEDDFTKHAHLIKKTKQKEELLGVEFVNNKKNNLIDVIVYTADKKGLFSKIAGALSVSGFSIISAKIMTLNNGMVLDSFSVEDLFVYDIEKQELEERKQIKIKNNILTAINGEINLDTEIKNKFKNFLSQKKILKKGHQVIIDNDASKKHTVIEINANDCYGFLYYMTKALTDLDLQIFSAHIFTYGDRLVDVFYVKDKFGMKIEHHQRLKQIELVLTEVISKI